VIASPKPEKGTRPFLSPQYLGLITSLFDQQMVEAEMCRRSLHRFVKSFWSIVESQPFVDGWHLHAICDHLQAVSEGKIRRLLINMPPRHGKSLALSVFWPAWHWLNNPHYQFLFSSYASALSIRDSVKCRRIIQSPRYQTLVKTFVPAFDLAGDQNVKGRFENNMNGYRLATSVDGANTGEGGDAIVCLPYDEMISTEEGLRKIGDLVVSGSPVRVWSFDHVVGQRELQEVEVFQQNAGKEIVEIELEDGRKLRCTTDHPIWTENRGYVPAGELLSSDICRVEE